MPQRSNLADMPRSVKALIEPGLLHWARKNAGLSVGDAAKKARTSPEQIVVWEEGVDVPTIVQLRHLARAYRRPLALFYLAEPPKDFTALRDYRRLPGEQAPDQSATLRFEVRRAHERREWALELFQILGEEPPSSALSVRRDADPEGVAQQIRSALGIEHKDQREWSDADGSTAYRQWRGAIEQIGVLVFQTSGVSEREMRGFSLSEMPLPVVGVNSNDSYRGRVFTMLHELTHTALRQGGLCDLHQGPTSQDDQIERFCNAVAGATLVPRDHLLNQSLVATRQRLDDWTDQEIKVLADRYAGASREVVLRRLLVCGKTTDTFYKTKRKEFQEQYKRLRDKKRTGPGGPSPTQLTLSRTGRLFPRLVLSSYHEDRITASDVAEFLEIRLKHLPTVEQAVFGEAMP